MKIKITLKDPDTLYDAINEAVDEMEISLSSEEEVEAVKNIRKEEFRDLAGKWFEYGEYVTLELDTEKETMTVLSLKNLENSSHEKV